MRFARTLVHLVLACVVLAAALGQARASAAMVGAAPHHRAAPPHHAAASVDAMQAGHDHAAMSGAAMSGPASPGDERPLHRQDGCQTACCFTPGQETARPAEDAAAAFFCAVTYVDTVRSLSGRTRDPDPEIPKHAA